MTDDRVTYDEVGDFITISARKHLLDLKLEEVWRYRELMYFFVWRELKLRYKQALIGAGWAVIQPVLATLIFTVIFGYFARMPSDGHPYALFSLCGLLPWTYFAESVRRGSTGLVDDAQLIRKIYFPRLLIPLAMVVAPVVDLALSFGVLLFAMVWYGIEFHPTLLLLPVFVLLAIALALTIDLWLAPINVRYRDVKHAIPFLIQVWMYATPIVYPLSVVPEQWRLLYSLNPMVGVVEGFRWAILDTAAPEIGSIAASAGVTCVMLLCGLVYYKRHDSQFADVI